MQIKHKSMSILNTYTNKGLFYNNIIKTQWQRPPSEQRKKMSKNILDESKYFYLYFGIFCVCVLFHKCYQTIP